MALYSGITLSSGWGAIWDAEDQTKVGYMKDKCPPLLLLWPLGESFAGLS